MGIAEIREFVADFCKQDLNMLKSAARLLGCAPFETGAKAA